MRLKQSQRLRAAQARFSRRLRIDHGLAAVFEQRDGIRGGFVRQIFDPLPVRLPGFDGKPEHLPGLLDIPDDGNMLGLRLTETLSRGFETGAV
ncbi:MAG TPA: hypothetical protein VNJ12_07935 [Candidatus Dormibacteraeota bacterium]|nr:hypothetical protein [Candidatus Dormibacteraeota bacterium]